MTTFTRSLLVFRLVCAAITVTVWCVMGGYAALVASAWTAVACLWIADTAKKW